MPNTKWHKYNFAITMVTSLFCYDVKYVERQYRDFQSLKILRRNQSHYSSQISLFRLRFQEKKYKINITLEEEGANKINTANINRNKLIINIEIKF